ncbi:hypothetical protein [Brevundimonas sp.]|uniref:hypothetical protein n=1 Tax=Brevundimonas sp. TaxID=1871086 RepID=UPI00286B342C|nr:hypothetical protein [Brevundimonas sp.]
MSLRARRKINQTAALTGVFAAVAVNAVGAGLDWWEASGLAVFPMLGFGLAMGWLLGRRQEERE